MDYLLGEKKEVHHLVHLCRLWRWYQRPPPDDDDDDPPRPDEPLLFPSLDEEDELELPERLDPLDPDLSRFSSPYPVPVPDDPVLPRDGFDPPIDPEELSRLAESLCPLEPPNESRCDPDRESEGERDDDPLPELPDPLMPLFELSDDRGEPDEPWSFLLFAILPPALFGRTENATQTVRSNASAARGKGQHSRHFAVSLNGCRNSIPAECPLPDAHDRSSLDGSTENRHHRRRTNRARGGLSSQGDRLQQLRHS
jgi:hypothetical protein